MKSKRTTIGGLIGAAIVVLTQGQNWMDGTAVDFAAIASVCSLAWALFEARDDKVTSEQAGAK